MSEAAELLDPRVQVELERLNSATDEINRREVELDEARLNFRRLLAESHLRIQQLTRKLGASVHKARPYYEARFRANAASQELQAAALAFEKANSAHSAAREMVYLAEQGLCQLAAADGEGAGVALDPAWQEMLNHATSRVNQAESERASATALHRTRAAHHRAAAAIVQQLQSSLKRHIAKSRPYFEEKARINSELDKQKCRVESLERSVGDAKLNYAHALRSLERISDEIHRHRSQQGSLLAGHEGERVHNGDAHGPKELIKEESKDESVREWLHNPQNLEAESPTDDYGRPLRPKNLPQDFGDKCVDLMTPRPNGRTPKTPRPAGSPHGPDSDNWTEINLEYSSPEEISFEKCSNFSNLENGRQVPYERLTGEAETCDRSARTTPDEEARSPLGSDCAAYTSRVSAASPRRIIKPRAMSVVDAPPAAQVKRTGSVRGRLRAELPGWMRREERSPTRRQSLDVILNDTGERVKEIFSQGFTLFNMSSVSERRTSEPRAAPLSPPRSPAHPPASATGQQPPPRRMPSPLDKTLSYLNAYGDSDDQGSDTDSLASVEMLTDEQIHSLMLDTELEAVCSQLMGVAVTAPAAAARAPPAPLPPPPASAVV